MWPEFWFENCDLGNARAKMCGHCLFSATELLQIVSDTFKEAPF